MSRLRPISHHEGHRALRGREQARTGPRPGESDGRTFLALALADVDDVDEVVDVLLLLLDVVLAYGVEPDVVAAVLGRLEARDALVPQDALLAVFACDAGGWGASQRVLLLRSCCVNEEQETHRWVKGLTVLPSSPGRTSRPPEAR